MRMSFDRPRFDGAANAIERDAVELKIISQGGRNLCPAA